MAAMPVILDYRSEQFSLILIYKLPWYFLLFAVNWPFSSADEAQIRFLKDVAAILDF